MKNYVITMINFIQVIWLDVKKLGTLCIIPGYILYTTA